MIRVGFIISNTSNEWLGGSVYVVNLLHAIHSLPAPRIEPVVFVPSDTPDDFLGKLPPIEVVRSPIVDDKIKLNYLRKAARTALRRDFVLEYLLKSHGIAALSHSGNLGSRARLPTLQWIPDFQHFRLPQFFEAKELASIDKWFGFICKHASLIILSSFEAQRDLADFDRDAVAKSRVLHFVSGFGAVKNSATSLDELRARYGFEGSYLFLPNQFWAHKNHRVVIEALALLKARGRRVLILATGRTRDRRHPEYFGSLMELAKDRGVEDSFRVLSLVPYDDVVALMRHSVAVINPSLFEGWSTTVEEAKSMGKSVLLSDIAVHREQAPEWGTFFAPDSPEGLADAIERISNTYSVEVDAQRRTRAQNLLPDRMKKFASAYEDIVLEVCGGKMPKKLQSSVASTNGFSVKR